MAAGALAGNTRKIMGQCASTEADPINVRRLPMLLPERETYKHLSPFVSPGKDEFTSEQAAAKIALQLNHLTATRSLPLAGKFLGRSPLPTMYDLVAEDVYRAKFDTVEFQGQDPQFQAALAAWLACFGHIRRAQFFVLPNNRVRYEISSEDSHGLHYRVGEWKQIWDDAALVYFSPVEEIRTTAIQPLFTDVTAVAFGNTESFRQQLARGANYWRAKLDVVTGVDVYAENGIAVGDIDGDGWDEVYVCQSGGLPNRLYKHQRNQEMVDISEKAGVAILDNTSCALFLDLRNIGRQDLVVLTTNGPLLFLNQGNGTFVQRPQAFRFAARMTGSFTGMAAADYDNDGRLDLYLCTYINFSSKEEYRYPKPFYDARTGPPNFLFHNRLTADGDGYFEDVTEAVGLNQNNDRFSFAPAWCDYNGDGWPDLYVANDFGRKNLYRNHNGYFRDVAAEAGVEDLGPGMSAAWFDYDGDGKFDLYVSNMWTDTGQRVAESAAFHSDADPSVRAAFRRHAKGNSLFRNQGDGTFAETDASEGVEMGRWAWSSDGLDLDNDGSPEIYIAAGMFTNPSETDLEGFFWRQVIARSPIKAGDDERAYADGWDVLNQLAREQHSWSGRQPNVLYARRGGHFYDFSGVSGLDIAEDTRAFAALDLDGDGNLDLLVKNRCGPQVRALRNNWGTGRARLVLRLRGTRSNRDAIGAAVEVRTKSTRSIQFVRAGSGFLSQHTKNLHFGLANDPLAELLRIKWPSGLVQEFHNLPAGSIYEITEGSPEPVRHELQSRNWPAGFASVCAENQPASSPTWLLEPVLLPDRRKGPGLIYIVDDSGPPQPAGLPVQIVKASNSGDGVAAMYGLPYKYLFDYRADPVLPIALLIDDVGLAHKVYPGLPETSVLREDLARLKSTERASLSLPFAGMYYQHPRREYFRLGAAFLWSGYTEVAITFLEEAIRRAPEDFLGHMILGELQLKAGQVDVASFHLKEAVRLKPSSADAWNLLGVLDLQTENYASALADFQKVFAIDPTATYALVNCGMAYARAGNAANAEDMFRRALKEGENQADAANQLGILLAEQQRFEEARSYFEQAITIKKDDIDAINNLGVLYIKTRQFNNAIAAFRYGLQVSPEDETLSINLATAYSRAGDLTNAREILLRLLTLKESSQARQLLQELSQP